MLRFQLCCLALAAGVALAQAPTAPAPVPTPGPLASGIDTQYFDPRTRAQDDFYRHVNGKWLDTTEIPADKSAYGTGSIVFDLIQDRLHNLGWQLK